MLHGFLSISSRKVHCSSEPAWEVVISFNIWFWFVLIYFDLTKSNLICFDLIQFHLIWSNVSALQPCTRLRVVISFAIWFAIWLQWSFLFIGTFFLSSQIFTSIHTFCILNIDISISNIFEYQLYHPNRLSVTDTTYSQKIYSFFSEKYLKM